MALKLWFFLESKENKKSCVSTCLKYEEGDAQSQNGVATDWITYKKLSFDRFGKFLPDRRLPDMAYMVAAQAETFWVWVENARDDGLQPELLHLFPFTDKWLRINALEFTS